MGRHCPLNEPSQGCCFHFCRRLALPGEHPIQALGECGALLVREGLPGVVAQGDDPPLVTVARKRQIQMHPLELLTLDLLQGGRSAADDTLLMKLAQGIGSRPPAPDVERSQLDLGDRVIAQQEELPPL